MNNFAIGNELHTYQELRRRILEADPEIDTPTLADTLEGATNLHGLLAATARSVLDDQAMLAALKSRLEDLQTRLQRIAQRIEAKRGVVLQTMEEADIPVIKEPDFTLSLKTGPSSLIITDETAIPEWFWIPQDPKLDRQRLLGALRAGTDVTGATLSNARVQLQIRAK